MGIAQLFYTSCKNGMSNGMGFQTFSMSKSITEEEKSEIESYCTYIPPDGLPTQPSEEEIHRLFPVALSSFRLKTGKYCICCSTYTGKDYSGRYGNYFSHVLISENEWPFYPIELYGSSVFRSFLSKDEEESEEMEYLPELEKIPLGNVIDFDSISLFLKDSLQKRRKNLVDLMQSALAYSKEKKRIVFSDVKNANPFWIGAVQMSLPIRAAQNFSFTTYCYNPEDVNYMLCGIDANGSRANFNDRQKLYKYNVYNFAGEYNSDVVYKSSFIKRVEIGYTVSKEVFLPLLAFIGEFEYCTFDEDIDDCVTLFNIIKNGVKNLQCEDVRKAVDFAARYKSIRAFKIIFNEISPLLEKISTETNSEIAEIITVFLFKIGKQLENEEYIRYSYEFFFNCIRNLAANSKENDFDCLMKLYGNVRSNKILTEKEFTEFSLGSVRIKQIQNDMKNFSINEAKFYFCSIIEDTIIFNNNCGSSNGKNLFGIKTDEDTKMTLLLNNCLKTVITSCKDTSEVLLYFKDNYESISKIILKAYMINNYLYKDSRLTEELVSFTVQNGQKDDNWKRRIYGEMCRLPDGFDFLFLVYKYEIRENGYKIDFFINYCYEVFDFFHKYRDSKFSDALKFYLMSCSVRNVLLEDYKKVIGYIDRSSLMKCIDKDVFQELISDFEEKISIEDAKKEEASVERILELKNAYGIKTPESITELLYIGNRIGGPDTSSRENLLKNFVVNFDNMSVDRYESYLNWIMPQVCLYINDYTDHAKVKKALLCHKYAYTFYNTYMSIIEDIMFTSKYDDILASSYNEGYKIMLNFIIMFLRGTDDLDGKAKVIIEERIVNMFTRFSEKSMQEYDKYILSKINRLKDKPFIMEKWMKIMNETDKKRKKGLLKFFKNGN